MRKSIMYSHVFAPDNFIMLPALSPAGMRARKQGVRAPCGVTRGSTCVSYQRHRYIPVLTKQFWKECQWIFLSSVILLMMSFSLFLWNCEIRIEYTTWLYGQGENTCSCAVGHFNVQLNLAREQNPSVHAGIDNRDVKLTTTTKTHEKGHFITCK